MLITMPRTLHQLRVFVASPNDVQPEKERLEKIIRELNLTYAADLALQLELLRWETHSYPSFGVDAQAVINEQIGGDYDIFIGILWSRVGTPTSRFASGTLEEFQAAYQKWKSDSNSITLMIYFKDEPVAPSQLDTDQLRQVQDFKKGLPPEGGFYWLFGTTDEFETNARLHLLRTVQSWRERLGQVSSRVSVGESAADVTATTRHEDPLRENSPQEQDSELGLIDYLELAQEANLRHAAVMGRMTAAIEEIGKKTSERAQETQALVAQPTLAAARIVFENGARDLNEFSATMLAEIPQMRQAHADLVKYVVGGATMAGKEQSSKVLLELDALTSVTKDARAHTAEFRNLIANLPRMTVLFNKAKRRVLDTLATLDTAFAEVITRNTQVRSELLAVLEM